MSAICKKGEFLHLVLCCVREVGAVTAVEGTCAPRRKAEKLVRCSMVRRAVPSFLVRELSGERRALTDAGSE